MMGIELVYDTSRAQNLVWTLKKSHFFFGYYRLVCMWFYHSWIKVALAVLSLVECKGMYREASTIIHDHISSAAILFCCMDSFKSLCSLIILRLENYANLIDRWRNSTSSCATKNVVNPTYDTWIHPLVSGITC